MRKIIMFNLVTLDGYFADENGGIDWHVVDPEFDRWAAETIDEYDAFMLGRVTYDLFAGFWPGAVTDPNTKPDDLVVAKALNDHPKIVISKNLQNPSWGPAEVWNDLDSEKIRELKSRPGKNIALYGSGTIVRQLTELGVIDEYRFMVNPVILGRGKPLFADVKSLKLKLLDTRTFNSGNVLLRYSQTDTK